MTDDDDKIPEPFENLDQIVENLLKEMADPNSALVAAHKKFVEIEMDEIFKCFNCNRKRSEQTKDSCCEYCKPKPRYPDNAPDGTIFVCGACGKTSFCIYGDGSSGWDESCMLNAVLCEADSFTKDGVWKAVTWNE